MLKKILREPIVHFLLIGALLFFVYQLAGDGSETDDARIVIQKEQIQRIKAAWEKQWRRQPTEKELQHLIDQYIQEEVLYREALALGLEKDDTIVRRRLAQKMKFLIQDIADQIQPDQATLKAFYQDNLESYRLPERRSFTHVYINPDRRGDQAVPDALKVLADLKSHHTENAPERGDPFMLHHDYAEVTQQDTERLFGMPFAQEVFALELRSWQGPIRSGYGLHLVRVDERVPERTPEFDETADRVHQDFMDAQRRKANTEAIQRLKERYRITRDEKELPNKESRTAAGKQSGGTS